MECAGCTGKMWCGLLVDTYVTMGSDALVLIMPPISSRRSYSRIVFLNTTNWRPKGSKNILENVANQCPEVSLLNVAGSRK